MTRTPDFLISLLGGIIGVTIAAYAFGLMQHDARENPDMVPVEIIASTTDWDI